MKRILTLTLLIATACAMALAKDYSLTSPDGKLVVTISNGITISVSNQGTEVVKVKAAIEREQSEARFGSAEREQSRPKVKAAIERNQSEARFGSAEREQTRPKAKTDLYDACGKVLSVHTTKTLTEHIVSPFYRQKEFNTAYRQADVKLSGGFGMEVRAYNEGVAYRFLSTRKGETVIQDESAVFGFPEGSKAWLAYTTNPKKPYAMAFQNTYHETQLVDARPLPAFLPATVESGDVKVTILESDLRSYPGMFVKVNGNNLMAEFAKYPKRMNYYRWRGMSYVAETEEFIAKSTGARTYPWRIMAISKKDTEMPVNNMVYALAEPNKIGDTSWIKPGKVAWDWWNDWNLKGVDFVAGINTRTYQYYIDFAASNKIPYVVLDEGWYDSGKGDIMNPIADIDLQGLIDYGKERGVSIVLWTVFNVLDEHLQEACEKYAKMGIKGWKIDFLDRNDQTAVEMAERLAKTCAAYKLFVDYHGFYTPTGMNRTYPNILNYEGVFGMEECRWAKKETDMPRYDVTFPFIRMMAGQVDFTPGAMHNGTKENWVECYQNPVSMGTRCHQAACYVVHDSPFTMLCDAPTNYEKEPDYTSFIATIPDEWDETRVLQGEMGKFIVTARRKGDTWYVGGQTNWDARNVTLVLDFLKAGQRYTSTLLCDGINADHNAEDYRREVSLVDANSSQPIHLTSGGGFVMQLQPYPVSSKVTAVPQDKGIPDFYKKYAEADGLYVTSSDKVSDEALQLACNIMALMLLKRPDIKKCMADRGCHVMIIGQKENTCDLPEFAHICDTPEHIAYWNKRARGFGGAPEDDLSASCGEENLLALPGDKYEGENILIHEFSHLIHTIGIRGVEPDFDRRLDAIMQHARENNLWKDTYALTDRYEYFAECTQSFFNCNKYVSPTNGIHNDVNRREKLKAYDPMMYALLCEYFPEIDIPIRNIVHP